jgi:phosphoesterase RecJ-like protein
MTPHDWDGALAALTDCDNIIVACHVNPDGDALGSLLAATLGLSRLGKNVQATWGTSPAQVPLSYRFLPGADSIVSPDVIASGDNTVLLALDCGAASRLGDLEPLLKTVSPVINIDHHPGNDEFGTLNIVVTDASSAAEIVAGLLKDLGVEIDRDIAMCLYTGIVTDTGNFQYSNSTPNTLRLAAELLEHGVDAPAIAIQVYESSPFGYLQLLGRVLERATLVEDRRFIYSWLKRDDLKATGVGVDETDKLIDAVRSTRDADVAAIFKEQNDGKYRVSLRSKGPNVGAIARSQGGGGHDLAAGFTASDVESGVKCIRAGLATVAS